MRLHALLGIPLVMAAGAALSVASTTEVEKPVRVEVEILDYQFRPATLKVKPGTVVRWTNKEKRTSHSIRFTSPEAPESERLLPGDTWEKRFDKPGRHAYTCGPHPEMMGVIDVAP
ncbi:MAG: cupredoxin domain-containing protein [Betaproteobacteria bacterium]|nr:cupredoxin domain-containing protein [Betaproteobacteria bacterium]